MRGGRRAFVLTRCSTSRENFDFRFETLLVDLHIDQDFIGVVEDDLCGAPFSCGPSPAARLFRWLSFAHNPRALGPCRLQQHLLHETDDSSQISRALNVQVGEPRHVGALAASVPPAFAGGTATFAAALACNLHPLVVGAQRALAASAPLCAARRALPPAPSVLATCHRAPPHHSDGAVGSQLCEVVQPPLRFSRKPRHMPLVGMQLEEVPHQYHGLRFLLYSGGCQFHRGRKIPRGCCARRVVPLLLRHALRGAAAPDARPMHGGRAKSPSWPRLLSALHDGCAGSGLGRALAIAIAVPGAAMVAPAIWTTNTASLGPRYFFATGGEGTATPAAAAGATTPTCCRRPSSSSRRRARTDARAMDKGVGRRGEPRRSATGPASTGASRCTWHLVPWRRESPLGEARAPQASKMTLTGGVGGAPFAALPRIAAGGPYDERHW